MVNDRVNDNIQTSLKNLLSQINATILGNPDATKLALCCLLARGHLLIEDVPGVGKTTLAKTLATVLGLPFNRVQFTSDLLPSDIIGVSIFDQNQQGFRFVAGPIVTSVLLADEINRASPKTQSALLQAMEERKVSVDNETLDLPDPFFVIATQNPLEQSGTFPLPESQLDRFLMKISLGYPPAEAEKSLLANGKAVMPTIEEVFSVADLNHLLDAVNNVHASEALITYLQSLLHATRHDDRVLHGLSPRAGLQWLQAAKAWALLHGRNMVIPEDIQALAPSVIGHRVVITQNITETDLVTAIIQNVAIPK